MKTNFDSFFDGYIECALWASDGETTDNLASHAIAASTLTIMEKECRAFYEAHLTLLSAQGTPEQGGHDFWLTRNGHGTGFWDRDTEDVGEQLTEYAHKCGERHLYLGDDGLVYQMEG